MPTYDYQCACGRTTSVFQSIGEYTKAPNRPTCHGTMERKLSVNAFSGLANALAGDRHYDGMCASDGTDISTRTKHREYMKRNNLTTADDFSGTWKQAAKERQAFRTATHQDKSLKETVAEQVYKTI